MLSEYLSKMPWSAVLLEIPFIWLDSLLRQRRQSHGDMLLEICVLFLAAGASREAPRQRQLLHGDSSADGIW